MQPDVRDEPERPAEHCPRSVEHPRLRNSVAPIVLSVERQEDLLEVGRLETKSTTRCLAAALTMPSIAGSGAGRRMTAVRLEHLHTRERLERRRVDTFSEPDRHVDEETALAATRPSRRPPASRADHPTRTAVCCTSSSECEEKHGAPVGRRLARSFRNSPWFSGSSPPVGSSRIRTPGRCMNAWTTPSFWRLPFESSRIGRSSTQPNRSTSASRVVRSTPPRSRASESSCSRPDSRSERRRSPGR